jgi:hypothetical protein
MSIVVRSGSGFDFASTPGGGGGGTIITVSITPGTTEKSSPSAQVFTASASGGTGPYTYAWAALFSDGTTADSYLSTLSGSTTTLTPTNYDCEFLINCTAFDNAVPSNTGHDNALLTVEAAPDLTASISPTSASQTAPGGQVLTVTPTGGSGSYTYAWTATQTDGADANSNLSALTGNPVTLTPTTYGQSFRVQCVVTDVNVPSQSATTGAVVSVGQPPALVAPTSLMSMQLPMGTTTNAFTFGDASNGAPPYSYVMIVESSSGLVTLDTYVGQSATMLGLTDATTVQVTIQVVDSFGQTADATYVVGVGVAPVFNENALWNLIGGTDLRTIGSGSRSGTGTLTVGGIVFTVVSAAGTPAGQALAISTSGAVISQTSGLGTATGFWWDTGLLPNFLTGESILVNLLFQTTSLPGSSIAVVTFGDASSYVSGNSYGFSVNWDANGARVARRVTGGGANNYSLVTGQVNSNKTYAAQVLLVAGRIPYCTISEGTTFLGGPRLGLAQPMRGTYTGTPGAQGTSTGSTFTYPISALRIQVAAVSGALSVAFLAYEVRRLTRAS